MQRPLDSLVADIADDVSVDWTALERSSEPAALVREFRIIAAIGAGRAGEQEPSHWFKVIRTLLGVAVGVAALRLIVAFIAIGVTAPFRIGPRVPLAALLGIAGGLLIVSGRRDIRARALGGLFVLIATAFVQSYLIRASNSATVVGVPALWLSRTAPEALIPLALWAFAWVFPSPPQSIRASTIGVWSVGVSAAIGLLLAAGNAVNATGLFDASLYAGVLGQFDREAPTLLFWPALLLTGMPAFPYLLWKSRAGTVEDRSRVTFMALAIVAGLAPISFAVLLSPFIPALRGATLRVGVTIGLFVALGSLVPSTIYAVVVRKVMNVHLVIRGAVQHAVARQLVGGAIAGSVLYVAAALYAGRDRRLAELLTDQVGLVSFAALGLLALTFRSQLLRGVDRWFQRGAADYSEVMARLASDMGRQRDLRDLHTTLTKELVRTLHATQSAIVVVNDERSAFVSLEGDVRPLPVSSAIPGLFRSTRAELCLSGEAADAIARLLPRQDKEWLADQQVEWVFPLFDSSESLAGMICLGEGHGPAYTKRDRVLVSAMADQMALRMENLSLRQWPTDGSAERQGRTMSPVDWVNERAMQCPACLRVSPAETSTCECGSRLQPASVPMVLNGKFRVERVLGAGGMGVVYLALDMALDRRVAVKTMPTVTPRHVARLQREARAMASVLHPNLAMIYGAERWRDVPLLVVEYLDGGTLLDGLRSGPMAVDEALDLGIVLADALDRMHSGGLLHRDIKPSNIGYTADGLPKLLDFGLAAMLDSVTDELAGPVAPATLTREGESLTSLFEAWSPTATRTATQQLVGTPLYLSPEALAGQEPDASFDLWSLGVVLYEAICGRHPLAGYPAIEAMRRTRSVRLPDVRDFRPDCPPTVAAFLNDALSLSPERRPETAAEMRVQLQSIRRAFAAPVRGSLY